jgi:hypothetical protein
MAAQPVIAGRAGPGHDPAAEPRRRHVFVLGCWSAADWARVKVPRLYLMQHGDLERLGKRVVPDGYVEHVSASKLHGQG